MMTRAFCNVMCFMLATSTGCLTPDERAASTADQAGEASIERPHCVVEGVAVPYGAIAPKAAKVAQPRCFESFSDAIFAATGGRVRLPSSTTVDEVDDQMLNGNAVGPQSTFLIGIEYINRDFGGSSLTVQASFDCNASQVQLPSLSSQGWSDKISSSRAFSSCNNSFHYEDDNFGGASVNCGTSCAYVGDALNDRTSSLIYTN